MRINLEPVCRGGAKALSIFRVLTLRATNETSGSKRALTGTGSWGLAAAFLLHASCLFAKETEEMLEGQFPHVIRYELGASSGFYGEDQFTITSVRGDREHIEPGGSYLVEGSYTLASRKSTQLTLYCTTRGPGGPTPVQDGEHVNITKGTGRFYLYETNLADGWLHVSFATMHGDVYFGEKGRENTIKRDQRKNKFAVIERFRGESLFTNCPR